MDAESEGALACTSLPCEMPTSCNLFDYDMKAYGKLSIRFIQTSRNLPNGLADTVLILDKG